MSLPWSSIRRAISRISSGSNISCKTGWIAGCSGTSSTSTEARRTKGRGGCKSPGSNGRGSLWTLWLLSSYVFYRVLTMLYSWDYACLCVPHGRRHWCVPGISVQRGAANRLMLRGAPLRSRWYLQGLRRSSQYGLGFVNMLGYDDHTWVLMVLCFYTFRGRVLLRDGPTSWAVLWMGLLRYRDVNPGFMSTTLVLLELVKYSSVHITPSIENTKKIIFSTVF
jgi:hypothetical protein